MAFYAAVGKRPIRVRQEVPGHVANRLQAALWQEAYSLVERGIATVADIDTAISQGPGLRWAMLGPFVEPAPVGRPRRPRARPGAPRPADGGVVARPALGHPDPGADRHAGRRGGRRARGRRSGRARRPARRRADRPARRQGPHRPPLTRGTHGSRPRCDRDRRPRARRADGHGHFALDQELMDASAAYFRSSENRTPTVADIAAHYRARKHRRRRLHRRRRRRRPGTRRCPARRSPTRPPRTPTC